MSQKKKLAAALYLRVSSGSQDTRMQQAELSQYARRRGWIVQKIYRDEGKSGILSNRPALDELLNDCRQGRPTINVVLVWKFDRFARSFRQLTVALDTFRSLGIHFVSATEAIDTSTHYGEMLFHIVAALAQWERSVIRERVSAGVRQAQREGRAVGRPPLRRLTETEVRQLKKLRRSRRIPFRRLAKQFGVTVWKAHRLCAR